MEIGPIFHSRWVTLVCCKIRFYTFQTHPSSAFVPLAKFCVFVYFPSFFGGKTVRKRAVDKLLDARGSKEDGLLIRKLVAPKLNAKAKFYFEMCDLNQICEPLATFKLSDEDVKAISEEPCHNQCVERHVKLVSEVFSRRG